MSANTDQRLSAIEAEQHRQAGEITEIKSTLSLVHQLLSRIDGRMDEQARRLDDQSRVMAALIPQRLAAVPQSQ